MLLKSLSEVQFLFQREAKNDSAKVLLLLLLLIYLSHLIVAAVVTIVTAVDIDVSNLVIAFLLWLLPLLLL